MRHGAVKRAFVVGICGLLTVTLAACESTQQESAKIGRAGAQLGAGPAALKLGAVNHTVRVSDVTILSSSGRTAVAAKLTSTARQAQVDVPVLLTVTGRGGKVLYSNEAAGVEASLQSIALLRPGQSAWWVDDQVLASQTASGVRVRVGTGPGASAVPATTIGTSGVHTTEQAGLPALEGQLVNHSTRALTKVPVFAVAVRGGRVVAAGRAIVALLPGRAGASVPFQIFLVGNPSGASIELTAVPTGG